MSLIKYIIAIGLLLIASIATAGDPTLEFFPSDEELFEAFLRGEIEYETYLILSDLIENGIDQSELYLLEEIPNLNLFGIDTVIDLRFQDSIQAEPFLIKDESTGDNRPHGTLIARGFRKIEEINESRTDFKIRSTINNDWSFNLRFDENYLGEKEIGRRSFTYVTDRGQVKKMVIGNYYARFGLGLTVGYRGRFLDKDDQEMSETLLFPDYGGFNGLYIEGGRSADQMKFLVHYDRDSVHAFKTAAINLMRNIENYSFSLIGLGSFIENRITGTEYKYYQFGSAVSYSGRRLYTAVELAYSKDSKNMIPAIIFEVKYRPAPFKLGLSAWRYAGDYKDIAGGSRSGTLYQSVSIDTLDLDFRNKRVDQKGLLIKTNARMSKRSSALLSFTIYGKDRFTKNSRFLLAGDYDLGGNHQLRIEYRNDRKEKPDSLTSDNEMRFAYIYASSNFYSRSYIGYQVDRYDDRFLMLFNRSKFTVQSFGTIETWFNLDKFNLDSNQNEYFYSYIKEYFNLTSFLELGLKYSYRYSRNYTDREESIIMLEAKAIW